MLAIAKAAFNFAFDGERVTDDRAWRRVNPFKGMREARRIVLGQAELQRLADACQPGLRELVLLGAVTGARLGDPTSARVGTSARRARRRKRSAGGTDQDFEQGRIQRRARPSGFAVPEALAS